jgi:hypothetical protein
MAMNGSKPLLLAAELGSFSAAARRLNKAQSTVSTAIAKLEIDTGIIQFDVSDVLIIRLQRSFRAADRRSVFVCGR